MSMGRIPCTIHDLKADPCNPREMTDVSRGGLHWSLIEFGDLSGIVHNQRTGELVTGHQRVHDLQETARVYKLELVVTETCIVRPAFCDQEGSEWPEERYGFRVVDWPIEKQWAANLAANNPAIQGTYTDGARVLLRTVEAKSPKTFDRTNMGAIDQIIAKAMSPETPAKGGNGGDGAGKVADKALKERYQILITCTGEKDQLELLERLKKEGRTCRVLVS